MTDLLVSCYSRGGCWPEAVLRLQTTGHCRTALTRLASVRPRDPETFFIIIHGGKARGKMGPWPSGSARKGTDFCHDLFNAFNSNFLIIVLTRAARSEKVWETRQKGRKPEVEKKPRMKPPQRSRVMGHVTSRNPPKKIHFPQCHDDCFGNETD